MSRCASPAVVSLSLLLGACGAPQGLPEADLILTGARVWTGEVDTPWAEAVAIRGDRILAVGSAAEVLAHRTQSTGTLELDGGLVVPGFIDNHTHFDRAGALILGINLLDVADAETLARRVREAHGRLPEGAWILGGDWGAYEDWEMGAAGTEPSAGSRERFVPHRRMIEAEAPGRPVLLSRWDGSQHLANARALELAGLSCSAPPPGLDCPDGATSGLVRGNALERLRAVVPEKPFEQRLAEAEAALERLRRFGVTGIHDITPPEQLRTFQRLRDAGRLTARVYARPTLDRWEHLAALGIAHGFGDETLRIGGLKGFVDGIMGNSTAQFYEPFEHTGGFGMWRDMMQPPSRMEAMIRGADAAGLWPQVHAIGDRAIEVLLDMFERTIETGGPRERRFRVIHAQHLRDAAVADRFARLGVIAEMQPYHAIDDMRWMEERIGDRARWSYAFRTLHEAGVLLSFGSDWPGTNASWYPANPLLGVYAAVTRQTLTGEPEGGWFPEERIDVETALRAYTLHNAFAAGEEAIKGSLAPGKLADLAVLDRDLFEIAPSDIKEVDVVLTVLGGEVVYDGR